MVVYRDGSVVWNAGVFYLHAVRLALVPANLQDAKVEQGWGEPGFSLYERTTIRPALTLNAMAGGHYGAGAKSIIPARAIANSVFAWFLTISR